LEGFTRNLQANEIIDQIIAIERASGEKIDAHLLAQHARRLFAKLNLIPYNTVDGLEWSRPSRNRQEKFLSILHTQKIAATLRREKGHDIDAACGQLRLQTKRALLQSVISSGAPAKSRDLAKLPLT